MQIFRQLADVPPDFGPTIATIGNFDGVHRGHQWVIAEVVARARSLGINSIAITFDPHPARVIRPESSQPLITPLAEKLELLAATGIDAVLVLPFTTELSRTSARTFATNVLQKTLHVTELHEGENFRFGYQAEAGIDSLETLGRELGFKVRVYAPQVIRVNQSHPAHKTADRCRRRQPCARPPWPSLRDHWHASLRPRIRHALHRADNQPRSLL